MPGPLGCAVQRHAAVLVWLPVLLLAPVLDLPADPAARVGWLGLVAAITTATLTAVLTSTRPERRRLSVAALLALAGCVVLGSSLSDSWLPTWLLLAITLPAVVRNKPAWAAALAATVAGSVAATVLTSGEDLGGALLQGFFVFLAGFATAMFLELNLTVQELRRTREELARRAVSEERERLSRDLHDLLGHTLSVMVVKAQAVRRLAERDPTAAAGHAADIERVGREALVDVREAVAGVRETSLAEELERARVALDAAGIRAVIEPWDGPLPPEADRTLAWAARESVTNVLRHSGAATCRVEVVGRDGQVELRVTDDGVGPGAGDPQRPGGLDGLRQRLASAGGDLELRPAAPGFSLAARVPLVAGGGR